MLRLVRLAAFAVALSSAASGYYHWTFFTHRDSPLEARLLKFDLKALPDHTVRFFIAKQGPGKLVDGDSFTALASQIRRAGETWNVPGSALRVQFGGLTTRRFDDILAEQTTPAIDVVFDDDLPPGVLALSEPQTYTDLGYLGGDHGAPFAPIVRSRLQLASDLAARGQASHSDAFFLTLVHEFGHTLGLQHSMTASAMSTSITRATSKARPLTPDDVAGLALLYPGEDFATSTGAIRGQVLVEGSAANLASVVALSLNGTAVGAMTQPDGSYHIAGLPPGTYRVYAHPLPPAQQGEADPAGIVPPRDLDHEPFLATAGFETRFYPGVIGWEQATEITVQAGHAVEHIDFALARHAGAGLYNLRVFAYLGEKRDQRVHAPPLPSGFRDWLALHASGVFLPGTTEIRPDLRLQVIGAAANLEQNTLRNFPGAEEFLLMVGSAAAVDHATPVAVAVSTDTDLYVLPAAFTVTPTPHPSLTFVSEPQWVDGQMYATLAGAHLAANSRVLFDGVDALSVHRNEDGTLTTGVPVGPGDHRAAVTVLGPEGQSSWQLRSELPPLQFAYPASSAPFFTIAPGDVIAGTDVLVEVAGARTAFERGAAQVGFDTSDIAVRQTWITGENRLLLNLSISPAAKLGNVAATIATDLLLLDDGLALQVRPRADQQMSLRAPILNATTGLAGAPAAAEVAIETFGAALPADVAGWAVFIGERRTNFHVGEDGRLRAVVPPLLPGPYTVQVVGESGNTIPVVGLQVDTAPPRILSISGVESVALSASHSLTLGDLVTLSVSGLETASLAAVEVRAGGVRQKLTALETDPETGVSRLRFVLEAAPTGSEQTFTVRVGTRMSEPFLAGIAPAPEK